MLFDKKKYYNYITTKENIIDINIVISAVICLAISIIINHIIIKGDIIKVAIIGAIIGLILGYIKYRKEKIKVEEMKMKLDIYEKIINGKSKD